MASNHGAFCSRILSSVQIIQLFLVSKGLPEAVGSKQFCLCMTSPFPPHRHGQHLEVFCMESAGAGAILCCLIVSTVRCDCGLSSPFESRMLIAAWKSSMGSFPSRREGSFQEEFWKTNIVNVLPTLCASPGCVFFIVKKSMCPIQQLWLFIFLVILSFYPDLLSERVICKTKAFSQKQFFI